MSIVEFDGPPSWSLDVSETGESTKCLWVGLVEGETVTASHRLLFKDGGREKTCQITEI